MIFKKNRYKIFLFCFLIGFIASIIIFQQKWEKRTEIDSKKSEVVTIPFEKMPVLKTSDCWVLLNITIDDDGGTYGALNWSQASSLPNSWCKGGGLLENPYVIENVTIDGQGVRNCIYITDSSAYFQIKNCTIYNSSSGGNSAGIYLKSVTHGVLNNNTISFCKSGIYLESGSDYNNISNNIIYNASSNGIFLNYVGSNNVTDNTIFNSSGNGIKLFNCMNTIIENNIIYNINGNGTEFVANTATNNIIKNNIIYNNSESGVIFDARTASGGGLTIDIINNQIKNNGHYGIHIIHNQHSKIIGNLIDHNGYRSINKKGGICVDTTNLMDNYIEQNIISNNNIYGINVTSSCIVGDTIYNNTFLNQKVHAIDDGSKHCNWYYDYLGNYWDDYYGKDPYDVGYGDVPYYLLGGVDNFPIWWDAPVISNTYPVQGTEYSTNAPDYTINVNEGRGDYFWYEIIGSGSNQSYTDLYGTIHEITSGTINQTLWNSLPQGKLTIRFYVNDSSGYIGYIDVDVIKRIPTSPVTIILGDDDDDSKEEEDPYFWLIRAILAGAISASVGVVIKQSYSSVKKKRQLYELISKKLDEIEKLEQFFKSNLGKVDWESFQPVYKDYTKRKISQKDLIKEGKKSMGKSFTDLFVPKAKRKFIR